MIKEFIYWKRRKNQSIEFLQEKNLKSCEIKIVQYDCLGKSQTLLRELDNTTMAT